MGHSYSHLYNIPIVCLRFFTVYGPWGRPDMAPMLFAKAISNKEAINIFNNGEMKRDFTYIDDIVNGVYLATTKKNDSFTVLNIGNGSPVDLMDFITEIENNLGIISNKNFMPMQMGDVKLTYADTSILKDKYGYKPKVNIEKGVSHFIKWFKSHRNLI